MCGYYKAAPFTKCLFMSQFSICPLLWMCDRSSKNHKRNRLHEMCLRIICCLRINSTFEELLDTDGFVKIHKRNLQFLENEILEVAKNSAPNKKHNWI